jgi:hypothetical protein
MSSITTGFDDIVVTLYEGHYHLGVAALVNSLAKSDFKGLINVGYKGALPPWISQLKVVDDITYSLGSHTFIRFELLEIPIHFGYYKPVFIKKMFTDFSSVKRVYYFDPDIVINAPWSFFTDWVDSGVALCLDNSFPYVHENHPWRMQWRALSQTPQANFHRINFYVNSGFIGIKPKDYVLLDRWIDLTENYRSTGGNLQMFEKDGHRSFKGDQDLLNAAITISQEVILSIIGTEGMGFTFPAYLMTHAIGDIKPWKVNFFKELCVRGHRPDNAQKNYFNFCKAPINIFSKTTYSIKKTNLRFSALLGRLIG